MFHALLFDLDFGFWFLVRLGPPPPLLPLHPSHIAGNEIGNEGCIALSSSLVHLSHLEVLHLGCKCFWIQRVVVVALLSAAEFAFVALSRACFTRFCLILILIFCFLFDWGRHRRSSLSIPHTLQ